MAETRKVLDRRRGRHLCDLRPRAVVTGHSISANVETKRDLSPGRVPRVPRGALGSGGRLSRRGDLSGCPVTSRGVTRSSSAAFVATRRTTAASTCGS